MDVSNSVPAYAQWDEDNVDLSFQSVPDLLQLLSQGDAQLREQLYQQSAVLHAMLRQELFSVTKTSVNKLSTTSLPSPGQLATQSAVSSLSPTSAEFSYASSTASIFQQPISSKSSFVSQDLEENMSGSTNINTFSSFSVDDSFSSGFSDFLASENFHIYSVFCILLLLIFLFFITLFIIIFRCKTSFQKSQREPKLPLCSSYLKASISLEDSYSVAINIPAKSPTIPSSPVKNIQMTPYSPLSTFSTFHPLGQDRTSPEGSSCGEPDRDREEQEEKVVKEEEDDKDDKVINNEERESLYAKINYQAKTKARQDTLTSPLQQDTMTSPLQQDTMTSPGQQDTRGECLI